MNLLHNYATTIFTNHQFFTSTFYDA